MPVSLQMAHFFDVRTPRQVYAADLNGDGAVNGIDLGLFLAAWGDTEPNSADFNGDGVVDGIDLGLMLANWEG